MIGDATARNAPIELTDERPHAASTDPQWVEAWLFDFVQHDASVAMSIEYLQWPQRGRVAFHASVVMSDRPLISLVELDAAMPKPPSLEVRAPGLWTDLGIQSAGDHMTVDIEAFAVALDDPNDVFSGAYGTRTALGCELEWETDGEALEGASLGSYQLPCIVHGELLLADDTIEIDGWGWRSHRWGSPTPIDRSHLRGRSATGEWLVSPNDDLQGPVRVIAPAPAPDPSLDRRLLQRLATNDAGDLAWVRTVEQ